MPQSNKIHFSISERKIYLRVLDLVFLLAGFYVLTSLFDYPYFTFSSPKSLTWTLLLIFYINFFGEIFEMYQLKIASDVYLTLRSLFITVIFTTIFYVFTPVLSPELPENRIQIAYFILVLFGTIFLNRWLYIKLIFAPRFSKNILIIANAETVEKLLNLTKMDLKSNHFVGYISNKQLSQSEIPYINIDLINLENYVNEHYVNEIIVASPKLNLDYNKINTQLIELFESGMIVRSVDDFIEEETSRISEDHLSEDFYNNFTFSKSHQNNLYLAFMRFLDIIFSLIGIIVLMLLTPFIFIGNLVGNRGKMFYKQQRVGRKGKDFTIVKFRTMVSDSEKNGAVWAEKNDERITPFGKILRKSRIDEVPQFINVLKNDMSLIGPRPERREFVEKLGKELPFYALRHVIKPGLTGWAQVMHPYANSVEDQHKKLLYDLYYIRERNLTMDFKIIMKTISTILFFRGT
ncbi:MAG: exopolysaccharide biosynthesis polyprenyl glycosylphosphotransferase [Lutibacter sp.]|uniref:exopolysaccharide biosynthesis polyprenyl glycosylphosphotransferase n=1 Tax=Lutibacter sp. TaxID=1925666 RepID=UPI00299D084C|nr:exopolysaccharide biosynthesis polyprenyl glycosylphosphotransferase [Lutibacter sp.]MDX1828169.1 exopolysaccharide biosynthesis polyprenyl glycosylphosphotransferase [Lutibacter sp.]